jgi:hypothetical protein
MLTKMAVLVALCFLVGGSLIAAPDRTALNPKPLDIHVPPNEFGSANPADITVVLQSAASEIWRYCPRNQLGGIDVYHRTDHPQTDFKRTPNGRISIGLSSNDTYWAQYSFQFAHEFCHALANFGDHPQQPVRYPKTTNLWLEESLCETASLFTLRAMSRSWQTAPPFPALRGYSPSLKAYAENRLARPEHHLPAATTFLVWFQENQPALRLNPALRDRNTIIAIQLLPIFEAEPRGWETLAFLNRASFDANQSLASHFAKWRSQCPKDLRTFITQIATVFAVKT